MSTPAETKKGNRLRVTLVHDDEGGSEVYWARVSDDQALEQEGSFLFQDDGSVTFKCWTDDEHPFVLHIMGNRIVVAHSEDQPPAPDEYVFDTDTYGREALAGTAVPSGTAFRTPTAWRDRERNDYRIRSLDETDDDGGPLYWSNVDGWVSKPDADTFTADERERLNLPIGGCWERLG